MKKIVFFVFLIFLTLLTTSVKAQIDLPDEVSPREPIVIPVFLGIDPSQFSSSATVFSWITFFGTLATIGLIILWIVLIIRASIKALQSEGKPEGLQEAGQRLRSLFIGAALTFLIPVILSIIGVFAGIGNIFQWPKMFARCGDGAGEYEYYFQAYLDAEGEAAEDYADSVCGF